MSSILDLNLVSILLSDLNSEIRFKLGEYTTGPFMEELLSLESDGDSHAILFIGKVLWSSKLEYMMEDIPLETQMNLNERSQFEFHVRRLIMDRINILKYLEL